MEIQPLGAPIAESLNKSDASINEPTGRKDIAVTTEDIIFSALFKEDGETQRRKRDMIAMFDGVPVFKDEYYVFYSMIRNSPHIVPHLEFLKLYMRHNRAIFQSVKEINLSKFSLGDTDEYITFMDSCIRIFEDCVHREVSKVEYDRAVEMKRMEYVTLETIAIMEESTLILTEGVQKGYKSLAGYQDMRSNMNKRFTVVDNVVNRTENRGFIVYGPEMDADTADYTPKKVGLFGVDTLDDPEGLGGVHQGDMVSILAPSKGGKSNFCINSLHASIVKLGTNCVLWPAENGVALAESQMRARHFNYMFNTNTDVVHKRILDFEMIRLGRLKGEMKELEAQSWADFRCNGDYGRFLNIDKMFTLDTYLQVLDDAVNEINAKYVCIDYLGLLTGSGEGTNADVLARVYKEVLQYLKNKGIGGIFPGQFKQTVVDQMATMTKEELENMELRTVAGTSFEAIKTPDLNLVLYGNKQELDNGEARIYYVPSRISKPFKPIDLHMDLGTSSFYEVPKQTG